MPPVRVLHVIDSLGAGGAELSLAEMLPEFAARGVVAEVAVLENRSQGVTASALAAGIPVHDLSGGGRLARLRRLRRLIALLTPDVIHSTLFEADVLSRFAAIGTGIPVVTSLVNMSYGRERVADPNVSRWKLAAARSVDAWTARHCGSGFHAITVSVRDDSAKWLRISPSAISVIPRGRSAIRLGEASLSRRERCRAELGVGDDLLVVNIGRQEFQKGQSTLLRAVALLRSSGLPVRLVIAGREGNESGRLRELCEELDLLRSTSFLGHSENVPDLLSAADVFAFPSRFEGLGGSVLEALALGTPVVAADIPALREVLRGGQLGLLVPVDEPASLALAIESVFQHPEAARDRSKEGNRVFGEVYELDRVTDAMADWLTEQARAGRVARSWRRRQR